MFVLSCAHSPQTMIRLAVFVDDVDFWQGLVPSGRPGAYLSIRIDSGHPLYSYAALARGVVLKRALDQFATGMATGDPTLPVPMRLYYLIDQLIDGPHQFKECMFVMNVDITKAVHRDPQACADRLACTHASMCRPFLELVSSKPGAFASATRVLEFGYGNGIMTLTSQAIYLLIASLFGPTSIHSCKINDGIDSCLWDVLARSGCGDPDLTVGLRSRVLIERANLVSALREDGVPRWIAEAFGAWIMDHYLAGLPANNEEPVFRAWFMLSAPRVWARVVCT